MVKKGVVQAKSKQAHESDKPKERPSELTLVEAPQEPPTSVERDQNRNASKKMNNSFWTDWTALERSMAIFNFILAVFTGLLWFTSWKQGDAIRKSARAAITTANATIISNNQTRRFFQTSQRAYVQLGNDAGVLAEFGPTVGDNRRSIKLHFLNSGGSVARHFSAKLFTVTASTHSPITLPHQHRHRFRTPPFEDLTHTAIVITEGSEVLAVRQVGSMTSAEGQRFFKQFSWMANQPKDARIETGDIPPKGIHDEFEADPRFLLSDTELSDPAEDYTIAGDFEYCDIFGRYHCQGISATYVSNPIPHFEQKAHHVCAIESVDPKNIHLPATATEIEPCEQPDEQEYIKEPNPN